MKKGWQTKKLVDLVEVQNGYAFSSKDYSESGHFLMRIGNVQNGYISTADPKFIKLPADGSLQRFVLSEDDILVSLTGNVGRVGVIQESHLPAALNQRVARISIRKDSSATRELLLLFLCSDWFREELIGAGHGAAQQNVSTKDLVEIEIPVPPLDEQKRIVGLLDEAFEGLATAKANAEKNLQNARALFESHLQSVFTQRGPGWVEKSLEELGTITSSKRIFKSEYVASGVPFYRTKEIKQLANGRDITTELFISEARYKEIKTGFGVPQEGDILLTAIGTIGEIWVVEGDNDFYFKDGNVLWLKEFTSINPGFLKYVLVSFVESLNKMAHGSAYSALPIQRLNAHRIFLPSKAEQEDIVATLDALSEETQRLARLYERKLSALEALKKSLLHQAFTGQL